MLTAVVLLNEVLVHGRLVGHQAHVDTGGHVHIAGNIGHLGHFFQHHGVVHGIVGILAPGKGAVVFHQHGGRIVRIDFLEGFHNHIARFLLIFAENLVLFHIARAGNILVEIIGMGGADVGDILSGLRPGGGIGAMGVHHAADMGESLVQDHVGGRVGGGVQFSLHHFSVQVHYHHVFGLHVIVGHAAGLNHHQAALSVYGAYVAPGEQHQAVFYQVQVGLAYFLFQFFQHNTTRNRCRRQWWRPGLCRNGSRPTCSRKRG